MTQPLAARTFLASEAESLDLFAFAAAVPDRRVLHVVEITRGGDGELAVRVPGLLGEQFREEELQFAISMVASTADEWDDRLKQMSGGATHQEVLAGRAAEAQPLVKPGVGVGMYL